MSQRQFGNNPFSGHSEWNTTQYRQSAAIFHGDVKSARSLEAQLNPDTGRKHVVPNHANTHSMSDILSHSAPHQEDKGHHGRRKVITGPNRSLHGASVGVIGGDEQTV